ncbi:DUF6703 family protein [Ornithinimicrobium pekingense]|uniref:Uncharacterized protein n=1 Tax=Ornithinimicrobium pekingense TaxID=384677 RepID=A0ABQ2F4M3_9MICO|nr:DUF6703 family protein [Ornithinimicrobium pekingense]GGK61531.1 hypothetical protein GCM10011509_07440 [Ornithinimicrobium pekingense]
MSSTPSPGPDPSTSPGALRRSIEQASRPALEQLARLPVWLPFLVLLLLMVGGGFLGGPVGWTLVGMALAFILWLLYLSWPRLTTVERLMRLVVLLLFAVVTVVQLLPRG